MDKNITLHDFNKTYVVYNCFYKFNDSNFTDYKILKADNEIQNRKLQKADSIISIFNNINEFKDFEICRIKNNRIFAGVLPNFKVIQIYDGIVLSKYIDIEALIIIISHELAHVISVRCNNGHLCVKNECTNKCNNCFSKRCIAGEPLADYNAVKYIIPYICSQGTEKYNQIIIKGINQIDSFLKYESGYEGSGYHTNIDCRINVFKSSFEMRQIDVCSKEYCYN